MRVSWNGYGPSLALRTQPHREKGKGPTRHTDRRARHCRCGSRCLLLQGSAGDLDTGTHGCVSFGWANVGNSCLSALQRYRLSATMPMTQTVSIPQRLPTVRIRTSNWITVLAVALMSLGGWVAEADAATAQRTRTKATTARKADRQGEGAPPRQRSQPGTRDACSRRVRSALAPGARAGEAHAVARGADTPLQDGRVGSARSRRAGRCRDHLQP